MNPRIRELARQAELAELYDRYVEYCMKNADDDIMDYDTIVKKFAELIVQECARIAWNTQYKPVPLQPGSPNDCSNAIKQHFGVEE